MSAPSSIALVSLLVRRELARYFRTWLGYVVMAALLSITGLMHTAFAVGAKPKLSGDVLHDFFWFASGTTMIVPLFLSMRAFAEERQTGTYPLLGASPLTDGQLVAAKFVAAQIILSIYLLLTSFMPALVMWKGTLSLGHLGAGYLGLFALGAAATSIGIFGSALARSQILAVILSAVTLTALLALWLLARTVDGSIGDLLGFLALHHRHFRPFMEGTVSSTHLLYYASVCLVFLTLARNALEARRWQ